MRKIAVLTSVLICLTFILQAQKGEIRQGKMYSTVLGAEKEYSVYLPDGYELSNQAYPVLYLLHGAWGSHPDWGVRGNLVFLANKTIDEGLALPMIIVMPDAKGEGDNNAGRHMGYFDYPEWKYQEYFIKELIPQMEEKYRIKPGKQYRAVAGLSMGGGGSIMLAQKYPDYFSSSCSLSGALIASDEEPSKDVDAAFLKAMREDDPTALVQTASEEVLTELRSVRWYVDCGDDDYLAKGNVRFYLAMKEKNIPMEYRMRGGAHTWDYWQTGLIPVLQYVSIGFAK